MKNELKEVLLEILEPINEKLTSIDRDINSLNGKVTSLDNKVNSLNNKVNSLNNKVDLLDSKVTSLDNKVDLLSEKVESQHAENIHADEIILQQMKSIREDVIFVNRKVADVEMDMNRVEKRLEQ